MLAQNCIQPDVVIVIDDGSPVPARDELAEFSEDERRIFTLIEQSNAGVSAARNRGLAALPSTVDLVAFLDPDDVWIPDHLATAVSAFQNGADFYFSDCQLPGRPRTRFAECRLSPDFAEQLPIGKPVFWYSGDLFSAIVRQTPIGTPTVVFRRSCYPDLRFREGLSIGEDSLFWLHLVARGVRAAFSTQVDVECGTGVNICMSARWGTPQQLNILAQSVIFHRILARLLPLTPELSLWNTSRIKQIRRDFVLNFFHLIRRGQKIEWRAVGDFLLQDPLLAAEVLAAPMRVSASTLLSRVSHPGE